MSTYSNIPFTDGTFILKQTQPLLTQTEQDLIAYFAPGFRYRKEGIPGNDPEALPARLGIEVQHVADRQRRFAGDKSLPRSRYYSVCNTNTGDDRGTLVRELRAYSDYQVTGPIIIIDTTASTGVPQYFQDLFHEAPAIVFVPKHSRVLGNVFAELLGLDPSLHSRSQYAAVPLSISEVSIQKVIDLRLPDTADWFAYHLTRLRFSDLGITGNQQKRDIACFPMGPVDDFKTLLPILMNAERGSSFGDATQIAGIWLRKIGADAVVFPSARSNVETIHRDGQLADWYGWNLVDYRGAPPPEPQGMVFSHDFSLYSYPLQPSNTLMHGEYADPSIAYLGVTIGLNRRGVDSLLKVSHYEEQQYAIQLNKAWAFCVDRLRDKLSPDDVTNLYDFPFKVAQRSPSLEYIQTLDLKKESFGIDLSFPSFDDVVGRIVCIGNDVGVGTHYYDTVALEGCCADLIAAALQTGDAPQRLLQKCKNLSNSSVASFIPSVRRFAELVSV
ncbi:MAG: hypothetical protein IPL65_16495 [Lewinellaceae bacterium]|nr:hypothetical protein [Lewinellaceae bacterium]